MASFEFVVNGTPQPTQGCAANAWVYPEASAGSKIAIANNGTVALPYMSRQSWSVGEGDTPGTAGRSGASLAGVLMPGDQVDITSMFTATNDNNGGIVAIIGSEVAFAEGGESGTISWPAGVAVDGVTPSTMYVAQVESATSCQQQFAQFW